MNAMRTNEPQEYHSNTDFHETKLRDNGIEMAEGSLDSWDRDTWAENIIKQ